MQYTNGNNLVVANATATRALANNTRCGRNDWQGSFDYYRMLSSQGFAIFAGIQHEASTGNGNAIGIEQGLVFPFQNGQVELAAESCNLNSKPVLQLQARVIVNWKRILGKK